MKSLPVQSENLLSAANFFLSFTVCQQSRFTFPTERQRLSTTTCNKETINTLTLAANAYVPAVWQSN
jgi:hypothetical protein